MQALTKKTYQIFWEHSKRYKWSVLIIVVGIFITTTNDMIRPFLYRALFNVMTGTATNKLDMLYKIVWTILALGIFHQAVWRTMAFRNIFYQARVMSDLLNTCYEYLIEHSYSFFNNNFVGSMVTRVRRFQRSFEQVADQVFWNLGRTILRIAVIIAVLLWHIPVMGVIILVWSAIYLGFAYVYSRYKLKYDIARATQDTKTTAHLADTMTNSINLKLFTANKIETKSFRTITEELFRLRSLSWILGQRAEIFQGLSMVLLEFVIMYVAVGYWSRGILTIGDFALLQAYLVQMFDHLWDTGRNIRNLYESLADANEMTQMLIEPHEVNDVPNAKNLKVGAGAIAFKNVEFYYHKDTPILKKFNLEINAGERLALIGPSGGGKSTIVKLIFRFLDIQNGAILVDGQNIASVTQDSLRRQVSLVPQEPILFHRSLLDNIRYGKPSATEAEVIAAAKAAHCHEFISGFPEGYKTFVGERGVKLSGGERQRVAIARAILKNAPILVLDEATSSLDSESEQLIQDALKTLMKGKTTIVIAHRLSTIMQMDRIVVIDNGQIIEQGQHEELLKAQQGTYQRLWHIQAGGFA